MTKFEIIAKLSENRDEFRKIRNSCAEWLKKEVEHELSERQIGEYQKYIAVCYFYVDVIEKVANDSELKDALLAVTLERLFKESFIKPRNPIQQGLYLYELEGYKIAAKTIANDFGL